MPKNRITILCLLLCSFTLLAAQQHEKNRLKINAGVKIGFHASTYNSTDFQIDGYEYDDRVIQSNKIGYSIAPFIRFTYKKVYLQTETGLSLSHYYFEFNEKSNAESEGQIPTYEITTYCLQVPLLFGYDFLRSGAYGMSVFTGIKTRFLFTAQDKQKYKNFEYTDMHEQLTKTNFYWEIGLGVNIANFYFDFVYDIGLSNNTNGIKCNSLDKTFYAKRSDNMLNFSVGIMF